MATTTCVFRVLQCRGLLSTFRGECRAVGACDLKLQMITGSTHVPLSCLFDRIFSKCSQLVENREIYRSRYPFIENSVHALCYDVVNGSSITWIMYYWTIEVRPSSTLITRQPTAKAISLMKAHALAKDFFDANPSPSISGCTSPHQLTVNVIPFLAKGTYKEPSPCNTLREGGGTAFFSTGSQPVAWVTLNVPDRATVADHVSAALRGNYPIGNSFSLEIDNTTKAQYHEEEGSHSREWLRATTKQVSERPPPMLYLRSLGSTMQTNVRYQICVDGDKK